MTREEFNNTVERVFRYNKGYVTLRKPEASIPDVAVREYTPDTKYKVVEIRGADIIIEVKGGWLDSQYGNKGYWYVDYNFIAEAFPPKSYILGGEE